MKPANPFRFTGTPPASGLSGLPISPLRLLIYTVSRCLSIGYDIFFCKFLVRFWCGIEKAYLVHEKFYAKMVECFFEKRVLIR